MSKKKYFSCIVIIVSLVFLSSCSIKKMAMKQVADTLTAPGSSTVFTGDNDPDLVGGALPFTIKMYESLMVSIPGHRGLRLQTGSLYVMYANAFIQVPAEMLPDIELEEQEYQLQRAKNLYLRGRDILLTALETGHPGFRDNLSKKKYGAALSPMKKEDVPLLYWAAAGWLGAFAIDPFDMKLGMTVPKAAAMMNRVRELDSNFGNGSIHDFYVLYYGSMPDYMGGDLKKAREHYKKAVEASAGKSTSPHLSLATTVCVTEQDIDEFKALLKKVLDIDPDVDPENRLLNTINQRKARWLLEHADNFFVEEKGEDEEDDELEGDNKENHQ
ncbi:MAG: hypothetical protein GY950_23775 [bacterium]|nr:hypothetical protein [bacterium]